MKHIYPNSLGRQQSGSVLVLGLVLIMILSVLVLSSAKTTVLQQKMATNFRDKELSFQSAESALRAGESYLKNIKHKDVAGNFSGENGLLIYDQTRSFDSTSDWSQLDTREGQTMHQVAGKPVYIIEELPEIEVAGDSLSIPRPMTSSHFRVTSKSSGGTKFSTTILQTMYKK